MNVQATPYQIELLQHTLGLSEQTREPYRNHFVAGNGHGDMRHLEVLEQAGLMERRRAPKFLADGDIVFAATDVGRELAIASLPEPKKLTRYDDFTAYDDDRSFGEYLCGNQLPKFEQREAPREIRTRRYPYQYRMYRIEKGQAWRLSRDVEGDWCATKKEAKASYKAALKALSARKAA